MSTDHHRTTESGQTMAEYSVVLGVVILTVIAVIGVIGGAVTARLASVATMVAGLVT